VNNNNQHTPGPWTVSAVPPQSYWQVSTLHWADQLSAEGEEAGPIPVQPNAANARLIAAAPDLLKTCRVLLERAHQLSAGTKSVDRLIPDARLDLEFDIEDAVKLLDRIEGGAA
jgi:hypothetical protein